MKASPAMPSDSGWKTIGPLFAERKRWSKRGPLPVSNRRCFEAMLWLLWNGLQFGELPKEFPTPSTCSRRLNDWLKDGSWDRGFAAFVRLLDKSELENWQQAFIGLSLGLAQNSVRRQGHAAAAKDQRWRWNSVRIFQAASAQARKPAARASASPKHGIAA